MHIGNRILFAQAKRDIKMSPPVELQSSCNTEGLLTPKQKVYFSRVEESDQELRYYLHSANFNGLINQGSTCYLNTALQVLFMTFEFRHIIERVEINSSDELFYHLKMLFKNMKQKAKKNVSTIEITESLSITNVYEQQDAVEWFEKILSFVPTEASQVFKGKLRKTLKCLKKDRIESEEDSDFFSIPLSFDVTSNEEFCVENGLKDFFEPTTFDEDDWMYCDDCEEKTNSEVAFSIVKYPAILVLHLKRFYFDYTTMGFQKNCCPIKIPTSITYFEGQQYDLYGVINHMGGYGGGHYNAYIQSHGNLVWYCFDDSHVSKLAEEQNFLDGSRTAYMLVYRNRKPAYKEESWTMNVAQREATCSLKVDDICANNKVLQSHATPKGEEALPLKRELKVPVVDTDPAIVDDRHGEFNHTVVIKSSSTNDLSGEKKDESSTKDEIDTVDSGVMTDFSSSRGHAKRRGHKPATTKTGRTEKHETVFKVPRAISNRYNHLYKSKSKQLALQVPSRHRALKKKLNLPSTPVTCPGRVLYLNKGHHKGKYVVLLRRLPRGFLLLTGPFALNGVPLSRVPSSSVSTTNTRTDLAGLQIPKTLTGSSFSKRRGWKEHNIGGGGELKVKTVRLPITKDVRRDMETVDAHVLRSIRKKPGIERLLSKSPVKVRHEASMTSHFEKAYENKVL